MVIGRQILRNDTAVFGWAFMSIWMAMLATFTWLFVRDGGMPDTDPLLGSAVIALFWICGLAGSRYIFALPRTRVAVDGRRLVVEQRLPLSVDVERIDLEDIAPPALVEEKDSDGDPYFRCVLKLPSGREVTVRESNDRGEVEAARRTLAEVIAGRN